MVSHEALLISDSTNLLCCLWFFFFFSRAASLHTKQEDMLKRFSAFIDKHLLPSSQEKRSVALRLCVELVRRTPADLLPLALSSAAVKCIYACRVNKKHTLHQLAGGVLRDIIAAVGSDATSRLALASSFVQSGGVNFDANTGTKTVATLLEGLGEEAVAAHVKFLCSVVGEASSSSSSSVSSTAKAGPEEAQKTKTSSKDSKGGKPKTPSQDSTDGEDEAGEDDSEGIDDESAASSARGAVEALYSMAKNSKIANRAFVASACVSVLVRLSCFGAGATKPAAASSTSKGSKVSSGKKNKDGKKSKGDAAADASSNSSSASAAVSLLASASSPLPQSIVELIQLIEGPGPGPAANEPNEELAELATSKLLALLADLGHFSLSQLSIAPGSDAGKSEKKDGSKEKNNNKSKEQEKDKENQKSEHAHSHVVGVTVLDVAVAALRHISESGVALRRAGGDDDEDSGDEGDNDVQLFVKSILKTLVDIAPPEGSSVVAVAASSGSSSANAVDGTGTATKKKKTTEPEPQSQSQSHSQLHAAASIVKLRESLQGLLGHALFQCLTSEDVELQAVEDIATVAPAVIADAQNNGAKNGKQPDDDDEDDEDDDRPQSTLFDACMELLSVSGDHAVKGVRDSVKRVWNAVCQVCNIEEEVLDSVIATVVGEDGDQAGEDDGEDGSEGKNKKRKRGDDDEEEEEEGDSDDDEDGSESEDEDSEDDEEVKLGEEEAMDFLAEDLDEEDDEAVARLVGKNVSVLEHTEEADSALAQMLALRKQNRKKGLLDAKRNQLVVRSR